MPVQQTFIVRRGGAERFRALQDTFGAAPLSATITWDRRERDRRRRRRAQASPSARRRAERRGLEPSSWSALDFLVTGPPGGQPAVDGSGAAEVPANPVDGDLLVLRETSVNGPCSVSTVPGPAHVLLRPTRKRCPMPSAWPTVPGATSGIPRTITSSSR